MALYLIISVCVRERKFIPFQSQNFQWPQAVWGRLKNCNYWRGGGQHGYEFANMTALMFHDQGNEEIWGLSGWRDFLFLWFIYPPRGRFLRIRIWVSWSLSILCFIPSPQRRGMTLLWFWRESWAYVARALPLCLSVGSDSLQSAHSLLFSCPDENFLRQLLIESPRTGRLVGYARHELGTYASKSLQLNT